MAMQKWTLAFTVCGTSNSPSLSLSLPRMAMRMDAGFYKGVVHPISLFVPFIAKNAMRMDVGFTRCGSSNSRFLSLSLPRMAMQSGRLALQRCGSSNSRLFVLSLPRMAYGRWLLQGVVRPITVFVPFIAKNVMQWTLALQCGSSNSAYLSLSLPRMAMRMDAGFYKGVVCPIVRFFVPFIAKNGDAYGRWLYKGGSSNNHFFVPFIAKNGDAEVGVDFYKWRCFSGHWLLQCSVHPIVASLSLSLPRIAMQKWTLAVTVCGSSNNRFFVPFITKNAMQKWKLALTMCGSSYSHFFVPFIAKNDAYGRWLLQPLFVPFIAKNGDAYDGLYKGVVHPIIAFFVPFIAKNGDAVWTLALQRCGSSNRFLSLSLPRMAMRMDVGFTKVWFIQ
ncbi:hypothetical protein K7X08_002678 [Anisodus acutangulus]|uniref:Uncharacterized protein n=1 Tax=Anisodus acutangulus TaxID=402998 RepID=A0A9Q1QTX6_9SOLA|nr:hypothetical protein K7X08_002678 [Anisodus acutangulus]